MREYREEIETLDEEPDVVGDPEDEPLHEIAGVAPPCDGCGCGEAVEPVGDLDLCRECADRVDEDLRRLLAFVEWLPPTARSDLIATEVAGMTRADRGSQRDVSPAVVSANVTRARERLEEIADERGEA